MNISNNITLSICIATFNRAAFIGETLNSIISQVTDGVEVVIVDGASTDNTEEIVRNYQQKYPFIRYFRLAAKGGFDQDCCRVVELAQGKYCWLFSDDDVLNPGAIKAVLGTLRHNYGLVIVNAEIRNNDLSKVLRERCLNFTANRVYHKEDSEDFFVDVTNYLSFIGCLVIKRSLWDAREKKAYFGTLLVHVGVIFQRHIPEDKLVLADPLISIRYGNALWSHKGFEISLIIWPDLVWSFPEFSASAKRRICAREPWRSVKGLLFYRARGSYTIKEYREFLKTRLNSCIGLFLARIIAYLPGVFLNSGLCLYFSIFGSWHPNAKTNLADLEAGIYYYKRYFGAILSKITGVRS